MATTPNLGMTLLETGQRSKEATINEALTTLDSQFGAALVASLQLPIVDPLNNGALWLDNGVLKISIV